MPRTSAHQCTRLTRGASISVQRIFHGLHFGHHIGGIPEPVQDGSRREFLFCTRPTERLVHCGEPADKDEHIVSGWRQVAHELVLVQPAALGNVLRRVLPLGWRSVAGGRADHVHNLEPPLCGGVAPINLHAHENVGRGLVAAEQRHLAIDWDQIEWRVDSLEMDSLGVDLFLFFDSFFGD